jgi:phage tail tape-measure protein
LANEWKNTQVAYDLGQSAYGDNKKLQSGSMIGSTLAWGGVGALTTVAMGAAMGAAIGNLVPIIGTAVGMAVGGVIGYVVNKSASDYAASTDTILESLDKIAQLDSATQKRIYDKINEQQGTAISTFNELSEYIGNDINK